MRTFSAVALFACTLLAASSAAAQDRAQVGAFGGYTFGSTTEATTFGGNVQTPLEAVWRSWASSGGSRM